MTATTHAAPAYPNPFASRWKAAALVCLEFENAAFSQASPAYFPPLLLPLPVSLALISAQNSPDFQALLLFRALKTHTFNIVRGF